MQKVQEVSSIRDETEENLNKKYINPDYGLPQKDEEGSGLSATA